MPQMSAIVTLHATGSTVGDLIEWLRTADQLGLPDTTELLDGAHVRLAVPVAGIDDRVAPDSGTIDDAKIWAAHTLARGVDPTAELIDLDVLCVDLPVDHVERAECGEHSGCQPPVAVVHLSEVCASHG